MTPLDKDVNNGTFMAAGDPAALSARALAQIARLNLPPVPHIYELIYQYCAGDPTIVRAVDAHAGPLDAATCDRLYKKHLSEAAKDEAVRKISEQVQQAIADLATTVSSVKTAAAEYGGSLADVADRVRTAATIEELGGAVANIVENTRMMVQKNQELEVQLTSSSVQVNELRKNLDDVRKEAMTDGLTGLANRKAFDRQIHEWHDNCENTGGDMCLLMLDIDHFKSFNDTYGHQIGDQVLRLVARELTDGVKGRDFAARFGGEEFAILLPETPQAGGLRVAESLRKAVESKEIISKTEDKKLGRITLSIGVAEYRPGESVGALIGRADAALYDAKHQGRNRVCAAAD